MFRTECMDAVTDYALKALPQLVDAGLDGIFLE
jgi:predicted TIM-barrel enzyme